MQLIFNIHEGGRKKSGTSWYKTCGSGLDWSVADPGFGNGGSRCKMVLSMGEILKSTPTFTVDHAYFKSKIDSLRSIHLPKGSQMVRITEIRSI